MRESIANVFVINFIIVFTIIFIGLFATSSSYTKASKVKNMVLDIVEKYADEINILRQKIIRNLMEMHQEEGIILPLLLICTLIYL